MEKHLMEGEEGDCERRDDQERPNGGHARIGCDDAKICNKDRFLMAL
jgi:hypothetical protein